MAQTTGLTLTPGQFIEATKAVAAKLYANVIELQTGTVLECLPPKQRAAASRAVFDVLLKKKILPIAQKLEIMPWPLVYLEQASNIFADSTHTVQAASRSHMLIANWYDKYASVSGTSTPSSSNKVRLGVTYKSISKFAHDFSLVPYLLKEPDLYGLFQEYMLWSSHRVEEIIRVLPVDVRKFAAERQGLTLQDLPGFSTARMVSQTQGEITARFGAGPAPDHVNATQTPARGSSLTGSSVSNVSRGQSKANFPLPASVGLPLPTSKHCRLDYLCFVRSLIVAIL